MHDKTTGKMSNGHKIQRAKKLRAFVMDGYFVEGYLMRRAFDQRAFVDGKSNTVKITTGIGPRHRSIIYI